MARRPASVTPHQQAKLVLERVAAYCGFASTAEIKLRSNQRHLVRARQLAAAKLRECGWSLARIGRALGGKHHTTILHLIEERPLSVDDLQFLDSFEVPKSPKPSGLTAADWLRSKTEEAA